MENIQLIEKNDCPVCLCHEHMQKKHFDCDHYLCTACFARLSQKKCPLCRKGIYVKFTLNDLHNKQHVQILERLPHQNMQKFMAHYIVNNNIQGDLRHEHHVFKDLQDTVRIPVTFNKNMIYSHCISCVYVIDESNTPSYLPVAISRLIDTRGVLKRAIFSDMEKFISRECDGLSHVHVPSDIGSLALSSFFFESNNIHIDLFYCEQKPFSFWDLFM